MRKIMFVASILFLAVSSCQPASPPTPLPSPLPPTQTPTPLPPTQTPIPPTPTLPPTGISGTVTYTGILKGSILIFAVDQVPQPGQNPMPLASSTFSDPTGKFDWDLPPTTYYIFAFLYINRAPEGPPQANEPAVRCLPIELHANETIIVEVSLTDDDLQGTEKDCIKH